MQIIWAPGEYVEATFTPSASETPSGNEPLLIIWPAFGAPATFYRHLAPALADAGLASLVVEYPGRDTPSGIGRHSSYGYDALATDVHEALMRKAHDLMPEAPVFLLGHSLGGHVSLFAAAVHADDEQYAPRGVVLAASASPYWRGYGALGLPRSLVGTALMATVARSIGYWPGDRLKFWGRQSRVLVADWARLARTGQVRPTGARHDYDAALADYAGDVLAVSLPEDTLAPVSALDVLLGAVPHAHVTRWHAPTKLGHIQWVRRHETIVPIIAEWVHAHAEVPAHA